MEAINKETAVKEIAAWLDYKHVKPSFRDKRQDSIDVLVDAVMSGDVSIEQGSYSYGLEKMDGPIIKQKLSFPVGSLTELKYKPRETTGNLSAAIRNNAGVEVSACYGSILSDGILPAQLQKMDSEDSRVLQAIVSFFL